MLHTISYIVNMYIFYECNNYVAAIIFSRVANDIHLLLAKYIYYNIHRLALYLVWFSIGKKIFYADLSGRVSRCLEYFIQDSRYPIVSIDLMVRQIPFLQTRNLTAAKFHFKNITHLWVQFTKGKVTILKWLLSPGPFSFNC